MNLSENQFDYIAKNYLLDSMNQAVDPRYNTNSRIDNRYPRKPSSFDDGKSVGQRSRGSNGRGSNYRGASSVIDERNRNTVPRRNSNIRGLPAGDRKNAPRGDIRYQDDKSVYSMHRANHSKPLIIGGSRTIIDDRSQRNGYMNRGMSDLDDRSRAGDIFQISGESSNAGHPVSDERIALSMAIQHHSHKLLETDIDINEVWDMDDPLGDFGAAMISARNRSRNSVIDIEPTEKSFKEKLFAMLPCCTPLKANQKHFLPNDTKRIRLFLFLVAIALSALTAFYFKNGSFGIYAATFFSDEPINLGPSNDDIETTSPKNDDQIQIVDEQSPEPLSYEPLEPINIALSSSIAQNLADSSRRRTKMDTPLLWLIPKSGGNAVKKVMSQCFNMVEASDMGMGYDHEETLRVYLSQETGNKFVNVDMSSIDGVSRAKRLQLIESRLADVIISPNLYTVVEIFSLTYPGKAFALFRHPMDTAISMYKSNSISSSISMEQFFEDGSLVDDNWMTRQLSNKLEGPLNEFDLKRAKETIRRKFIVGLVDQATESVKRFKEYFGWTSTQFSQPQVNTCMAKVTQLKVSMDKIEENSRLWNLVMRHNQYDMPLFLYVQRLFVEQSNSLPSPEL